MTMFLPGGGTLINCRNDYKRYQSSARTSPFWAYTARVPVESPPTLNIGYYQTLPDPTRLNQPYSDLTRHYETLLDSTRCGPTLLDPGAC
jgi:hypothetical protein